MKNLLLTGILIAASINGYGQSIAINTTGNGPHPNAILDISSQDKGILIPRMTTEDREEISSPPTGLLVFDSDSRSFWFYSGGWQEIMNSSDMGEAGGDLSGQYPEPIVAKLQGHAVDGLTPGDKQVLKWDASGNTWKGMKDSLALPNAATVSMAGDVFSLTNMFNGFANSSSVIKGQRLGGSGFALNFPTAMWGDALTGTGVLGTSYTHAGVFGHSGQHHGLMGSSDAGFEFAGVFGTSSSGVGVKGEVNDTGIGVLGKALGSDAIAGKFENTSPTNASEVLHVTNYGTGITGLFESESTTSTSPVVTIEQPGLGKGLQISSSNASNQTAAALNVTSVAQYGIVSTVEGRFAILGIAEANSGNGIKGIALGNNSSGVEGYTGSGTTNSIGVFGIAHDASEDGIGVRGLSYSNMSDRGAVTGTNQSTGIGVYGFSQSGTGVKGHTSAPASPAVHGSHTGHGPGVLGHSTGGQSSTGVLGIAETITGTGFGVVALNNGVGDGVRAIAGISGSGITAIDDEDGTGNAATFINLNAANTTKAVDIQNYGQGTSLAIDCNNNANSNTLTLYQNGGTGDFAIYENGGGVNKIRFDNTGKGYFNGGTQTGGADIAEVFDVENNISEYEPGDVLVISIDRDRTVTKSTGAYSTLVAGVFATKPGVLMTEEHIDADLSGKVPMGVIGVIPTKVCLEGGAIQRGDLLVTSSISGVAMKGDPERIRTGQVLGKALENYTSQKTGLIRVLVNVK